MLLSACATSSTGNPKLQVSVPSCDDAQYQQLSAPKIDPSDASLAAIQLAAWGAENRRRAVARAACEKRVRENFARGGALGGLLGK